MSDEKPKCRGESTELFYDPQSWPKARAICSGCPILLQCRKEWATDPWAFAGGMTPDERRKWGRRYVPPAPRRTGTTAGPKISEATQADVVNLFDAGLGTRVISDRVGVSRSAVRNILIKNGRSRTPEERKALAAVNWQHGTHGLLVKAGANASEVMRLVAEGRKVKEIVEATGLSESHIYAIKRKKEKANDE